MGEKNLRDYFRIEYPKPDRPRVLIAGHYYDVVDVSEGGVKFVMQTVLQYAPGAILNGTLYFNNGKTCEIAGRVLRMQGNNECVLVLTEQVPLPMIIEEQLRLIKKYKY